VSDNAGDKPGWVASLELAFDMKVAHTAWVSSNTVIAPPTSMDIEPALGGHYRLITDTSEFSGKNEGKFSLIEPQQRDLYTRKRNGDGEVTEIDVRVEVTAAGTKILIHHTGLRPTKASRITTTAETVTWSGSNTFSAPTLSSNV